MRAIMVGAEWPFSLRISSRTARRLSVRQRRPEGLDRVALFIDDVMPSHQLIWQCADIFAAEKEWPWFFPRPQVCLAMLMEANGVEANGA